MVEKHSGSEVACALLLRATMALAGRWMGCGGIDREHEPLKIKGFPVRDKFIFI